MSDEIDATIQALPGLGTCELRVLWQELFAKPAHPQLRRDLMIPILAYEIQANAYGDLKLTSRKRLQKLAAGVGSAAKTRRQSGPELKRGTKLLRQWQGRMHEVLVAEQGFDYCGKCYRSLSEIAREITGTRPCAREAISRSAGDERQLLHAVGVAKLDLLRLQREAAGAIYLQRRPAPKYADDRDPADLCLSGRDADDLDQRHRGHRLDA